MTNAHSLALIRALPIWTGDVEIVPLSGGLSNESYVAMDDAGPHVVRLGSDIDVHHVSRDNELMASKAAQAAGFAPAVIHSGPGIVVFQFIDGKTYEETDVVANIDRITPMLRDFHNTMPEHVAGPGRLFWVFHIIRDYARTLEAASSRVIGELPQYRAWNAAFEAVQPNLPIIYGHGDLLPANFIDDGKKIWLIDYEYAAFSTPLFDLANLASNALFTTAQDEALLAGYFSKKPADELIRAHAAMKCASLLRETMWSMVSEHHLEAPGVDYKAYSDENLDRFKSTLADYEARYGTV